MTNPRFKILKDTNNISSGGMAEKTTLSSKNTRRQEFQARFDRMWLLDPKQFDPTRNSRERERVERTLNLILRHINLEGKKVADLGCGSGYISRRIASYKADVEAVDISGNALKLLQTEDTAHIHASQDFVPSTTLQDDHYDLVISTELIAYLPEELYRLYFSELSRLVKSDGWIVCSTSIDIGTEEGENRFITLAETEIIVHECLYSYHRFAILLTDFFKAPSHFIKAAKEGEYRKKELESRSGISHWWFSINSSPVGKIFWKPVKLLFYPFERLFTQNRKILLGLEKLCRLVCGRTGISHVMVIGKRKPLFDPFPHTPPPEELKHKKQLWE
jgi:2-polyprenyl-3-methyl-5-hydroxy-6-metoxy-1,4-benzoquinol methylase